MKQQWFWGTLSGGLIIVCGCSGSTVNPIGGGPGGSGGVAGSAGSFGVGGANVQGSAGTLAESTGGTGGVVNVVDPALGALVAGKWTGYVENFLFSDNSDAVTLLIESNGTGQVTFGASPPPPPATDPNLGYPPGVVASPVQPLNTAPYPGFAFTIENVALHDARLQFDASSGELWAGWCQLQTPIADETNIGFYSCTHNWVTSESSGSCSQTNPMTMQMIQVDCTKLQLCTSACRCTAQACAASLGPGIHFDLSLDLPKADGSVRLSSGSPSHNVHFTKD